MPKKKCFTKTANDGHRYQGCAKEEKETVKKPEKKKVKKIKFIVGKKAEPDKKTKVKIKEKIKFKVGNKPVKDVTPKKKEEKPKTNIVGKTSLYFNHNDPLYKEGGHTVDRHVVNGNQYKEFKGKYYKYGDAKGRDAKETTNPYTRSRKIV